MLKRLGIYIAILLGIAFIISGYFRFEDWKLRQEVLKEIGPILADEEEQKNQLSALGKVDLDPSDLTLATLEQRLNTPVQKQPGDFNTTRARVGLRKRTLRDLGNVSCLCPSEHSA